MVFKDVLSQLLERQDLTQDTMLAVMRQVMSGELTPAQIAAFLIALRAKGEVVIQFLPGHEQDGEEFHCDRELVDQKGAWVVVTRA